MRIGLYTPNYPGLTCEGGIGSYTRALAHGLAGLGHSIHVLTPGERGATDDGEVRVHFVRTGHFPGVDKLIPGTGACWRVSRAVENLIRSYRLDVFEIANWEAFTLPYLWRRTVPVVVRLYTSSLEAQEVDGLAAKRWDRWNVYRERWQARAADVLVTHSDAHRQRMAEELGVASNRIELIPLGIPMLPEFVRPIRRPGPPTVVYLGRLEHRKGTVELLQCIPRVLESIADTRFILIGADRPHCPGGRTHAQYLEQEFPAHVRRHVTLAGRLPQDEVDRWLQTADVFVAPSRYESFGLIFLEAMRWETPVIGTTAGGIPEIVEHDRSGLLVRPEAPDEIADAIVRLLRDEGLRNSLGAAGRRRAEAEFSVDRMVERVSDLYALVCGRKVTLTKRNMRGACHAG